MEGFKQLFIVCVCFLISRVICQRVGNFFRQDYRYLKETNSFYKIHTMKLNWAQAKQRCELEGAFLFYPEDQEEVDAVINFWNETQPFMFVFIGISDLIAKEVYTTVDGVSISDVYNRWAPGEPNNDNGKEDCVVLTREGTLNDFQCSVKCPFICKKTQSSIKWNRLCNVPDIKYNYTKETERCYKLHTTPLIWTEAALVCRIEQSYLAVINSKAEALHLVKIMEKVHNTEGITPNLCNSVALGFSKRENNEWKTILEQKLDESGYNQWVTNNASDVIVREQCGFMSYNGLLKGSGCDSKCYFICEHENSQIAYLEDRFGV